MAELPVGGEARGLAGVFGTSINPLSVYMQYSAQRQRNRAAMAAQQKADRDKTMDYLDKFNPSSKFKELNYKINETAQRVVRDPVMQGLEQGQTLSQMQARIQFNKGQVEGLVGESDQWKATIDQIQEDFDADPIRYNQNAKSALRDIYLNDDGTVKEFDQIRAGIQNADNLKFDPRVLNQEGVVKKFTEDLPQQSKVLLHKVYTDMDYTPDQVETMVKSGLQYEMKLNPRTGIQEPVLDDNLMPKVVVDEKVYALAKADPYMNSLMTSAAQDKAGQMKWLQENVRGAGDKVNIDRQVVSGKSIKNPRYKHFGKYGYKTPIEDLQQRDDILEQISLGGTTGEANLGYFNDPMSDVKASYSSTDGKKKGQFVKVDYVSNAGQEVPPLDTNMTYAEQLARKELLQSRKVIKSNYYDITTQDGRDKLKIALSAEMDRMNKTQAIAEDYPYYIQEKRASKNKAKAPADNGKRTNYDNAGL